MANDPLKVKLTAPQRLWLEAICSKLRNGKQVNARILKVELLDNLPKDFDPSKIDSKLLRSSDKITPLGIAAIDPTNEIVKKSNQVIHIIRQFLIKNPTMSVIHVNHISSATGMPEPEVADIFERLSFISILHNSGTNYGVSGWLTINIDDRTLSQYLKYESLEQMLEDFIEIEDDLHDRREIKNSRPDDWPIITNKGGTTLDSPKEPVESEGIVQSASSMQPQAGSTQPSKQAKAILPKHGVDVAAKYIFLDIVGFTHARFTEAQADIVKQLNEIVSETIKRKSISDDKRIFLPTGDGICIALLGVENPFDIHIQIALTILDLLNTYNASAQSDVRRFQVRIGIDANTDTLVADINNQQNIAGAGISMASRIMNLADGNQILVGETVYNVLRHREKYTSAFKAFQATVKHNTQMSVYQFISPDYEGLNIAPPTHFQDGQENQTRKGTATKPLSTGALTDTLSNPTSETVNKANKQITNRTDSLISSEVYQHSNTPQVATQWLREFLKPLVILLDKIKNDFNQNTFEVLASPIQPYSMIFIYKIDFFLRERWMEILTSDVGEYFLNRFRLINEALSSFQKKMDDTDNAVNELLDAVETSPFFLKQLIDTYARIVSHERVEKSTFENSNLAEIAQLVLGRLNLQISHYPIEAKDTLVRFVAYSLLGLKIEFPMHSIPEDRQKLPNISSGISSEISGKDDKISKSLEETKQLFELMKSESSALHRQLKKAQMDIVDQYGATF
jgi:class 3 adenylate cyclase